MAWLRDVLANVVDASPLSLWIKEATQRCVRRLPNWIMDAWAKALNFDYMTAYRTCPYLAKAVKGDQGKQLVRQYVEAHRAVPLANILNQLARKLLRLSRMNRLPVPVDMIERQVCAIAMSDITPQGKRFIQEANPIIGRAQRSNHPLARYRILLQGKHSQKLNNIDALLSQHPYNSWVLERIVEIRRWLGLEPPTFRIRCGERTPLWQSLWDNILSGDGL